VSLPRRIFLESTALFQLGPRLENADLARLLEIRASTPFEILIAEVSWMEFLRHRKAEVTECVDKIRSIGNSLRKHGVSIDQIGGAEHALQAYLHRIEEHFRDKASALGFRIVALPENITVRSLLEMSIGCAPPFESREAKSEKGFRDSLIMFTILQELRGRPEDNTLLVSDDGLLVEGVSGRAQEFNANIQTQPNLAAAVEFVETGMDENKRIELRASVNEAKQVLRQFEAQISDRIKEIRELDDSDLGQNGPFWRSTEDEPALHGILGTKSPDEYVEIHRLDAISYDEIVRAVWKNKQLTSARILFIVRCKARVRARAPYLATYDGGKKYKLGVSSYNSITTVFLNQAAEPPTEEREMPFQLYGEASLMKAANSSHWILASLRIDKSLPSNEELEELYQAGMISED